MFVELNNDIILCQFLEFQVDFVDKVSLNDSLKLVDMSYEPMSRWTILVHKCKNNFLSLMYGAKLEVFFYIWIANHLDCYHQILEIKILVPLLENG